MVKNKKVKKLKTIQLKQKQVINIDTHSKKTPLSKGSKPMPQLASQNMPTFNPIGYRVQPVAVPLLELERRMNDEIKNLKTELSTLKELNNPLKDKVIPEHSNQIKETIGIPETPKKKALSQMNALELRNELTAQGVDSHGMTKKQMIEFLRRNLA
jgi:hypothetical protein